MLSFFLSLSFYLFLYINFIMTPTGFATLPSMAEVIELTTSFDRTL